MSDGDLVIPSEDRREYGKFSIDKYVQFLKVRKYMMESEEEAGEHCNAISKATGVPYQVVRDIMNEMLIVGELKRIGRAGNIQLVKYTRNTK